MASLRKHINQQCKDCSYDSASEGTWREQVALCPASSCALWPVRPKITSGSARQLQKLREMDPDKSPTALIALEEIYSGR